MLHVVASSGSVRDRGEGFGCLERGRLHQTCGLLWSSLAGAGWRSTKLSISVLRSPKHTHTHTPREVWTRFLKMWPVKLWTKWSSLGKRWNVALRGFPWESLWTIFNPPPHPPSADTMESQTVPVRSVYFEGRGSGGHNELYWLRVGQLMILAESGSAVVLIIGSA